MKKALPFIAVAVILLTIVVGAYYINRGAMREAAMDAEMDEHLPEGLYTICLIIGIVAIIASEIGVFSGIALLLSKNRTTLKLIFGAVIVVISLVFLVAWIRSFFGLNIKPVW